MVLLVVIWLKGKKKEPLASTFWLHSSGENLTLTGQSRRLEAKDSVAKLNPRALKGASMVPGKNPGSLVYRSSLSRQIPKTSTGGRFQSDTGLGDTEVSEKLYLVLSSPMSRMTPYSITRSRATESNSENFECPRAPSKECPRELEPGL